MRGLLVAAMIAVAGMCVAPATSQGCDGFASAGVQQFGAVPAASDEVGVQQQAALGLQLQLQQQQAALNRQLQLQQQQAALGLQLQLQQQQAALNRQLRLQQQQFLPRVEVRRGLFGQRGVFIR